MAYIGRQQDGFGVRSRFIYTATGGQTTFDTDDSSNALSYSDGAYVDVYLNGVLLDPSDYTATSLTSIVLDSGASADDVLEVIVYDVFSVFSGTFTNGITASEATITNGISAGSATVTGDLTVDTNTLYVDSTNNRVGIGTTSPEEALHVYNPTANINAVIESGDANAYLAFKDNSTTGYAHVFLGASGNDMTFFSGGSSERMRLDSSGNVGIGTSSPERLLHVNATSPNNTYLHMTNSTTGSTISDGFDIVVTNSTGEAIFIQREAQPISFRTDGTERMRLDSSGLLGLGTSSPTSYANSQTALVVEDSGSPAIVLSDTGQTRDWFLVAQGSGLYFNYADGGGSGSATNVTQALYLSNSGQVAINTTSFANYAQTSGDSNWAYRTSNGSVIQAQDADDGFAMMYMNKFDWTSSKDSRYINWYKNGSSVGSISLTSGGLISYGGTSDYRLKENIVDMTGAIDRIKQAQPKQFNMIDDANDTTQDGFLAHELETVVPEAVTGTHNEVKTRTNVIRSVEGNYIEEGITEDEWTAGKTDGVYPTDSTWSASWDEPIYQMADYAKLTPLLTAALQEAIAKIETLEAKVTALENA